VANPLTGDFDSVLQVSGPTIDRLVASIHQNAFSKPGVPSFPHSPWIRLGDDYALDGVSGSLQVQISAPSIVLLDRASDRFGLLVGVRIRYVPDPSTQPLPTFIHGMVRAEYEIADIDPNCIGWRRIAAEYLWIRVIEDSVEFDGTTAQDLGGLGAATAVHAVDPALEAAQHEEITKQIAWLLATRFAAAPHPVSERFRRGALISLAPPGAGTSGVAVPVAVAGGPAGDVASITELFLDGSDYAIAVAEDYMMSLVGPFLEQIGRFTATVPVTASSFLGSISTVYRVHMNAPNATWQPHGSFAVIKISASGSAETDSLVFPNATFDVEQDLVVNFDAGAERLWLSPGSRTVSAHVSGVGSGEVSAGVAKAVGSAVKSLVEALCTAAQPTLDAVIARRQELIQQLRTIDDACDAGFDSAEFTADGAVLRGWISVAPRRHPVVSFEKSREQDGFTALESWIPGGRIDKFEWSWGSSTQHLASTAVHDDRFVLRRSRGPIGRFQMPHPSVPLPGIDGAGSVCLTIVGVQIDPVTGDLVPIRATSCRRFGLNSAIMTPARVGRLLVRELQQPKKGAEPVEVAVVALGRARGTGSNTLLVSGDKALGPRSLSTLKHGLELITRKDAGLSLIVLFAPGALDPAGREAAEIQALGAEVGVPTLVNEDVGGAWSAVLVLGRGDRPSWRLISPGGGVTWMHDGPLDAERLASALDHCLIASPPPLLEDIQPDIQLGAQLSAGVLDLVHRDPALHGPAAGTRRDCPPLPVHRPGLGGSVISFVQPASRSSDVTLRALADRYGQDGAAGPLLFAVVDGVDDKGAQGMKDDLGIEFTLLGDSTGAVADRLGIRAWPTTLTLDQAGLVAAIEVGAPDGSAGPEVPLA
jgi:hypothetical protein